MYWLDILMTFLIFLRFQLLIYILLIIQSNYFLFNHFSRNCSIKSNLARHLIILGRISKITWYLFWRFETHKFFRDLKVFENNMLLNSHFRTIPFYDFFLFKNYFSTSPAFLLWSYSRVQLILLLWFHFLLLTGQNGVTLYPLEPLGKRREGLPRSWSTTLTENLIEAQA